MTMHFWSWSQFSESKLLSVEQRILSVLKSTYVTRFVKIKWKTGSDEKIWTISLNTDSPNTPLVLLHGFAAGIGFWIRNLDALSKDRPVYAMDLLGFGRSSRPQFSSDAKEAEQEMVDSIEAWRKQLKLEKFILLGHSMGGFLAASYALSYPEHIKYLILADPWGFPDKAEAPLKNLSLTIRVISSVLSNFNPLASVRVLGPFGPWLIEKMRGDISNKFDDLFDDKSIIPNYIYLCNAQNPSGETAFHNMVQGFGWAKYPMIHRVSNINKDIPITFMNGSDSWIDREKVMAPKVKELRSNSFVDLQIVQNSGHHVYADNYNQFNDIIINACKYADGQYIQIPNCAAVNANNVAQEDELNEVDYEDDKHEMNIDNR